MLAHSSSPRHRELTLSWIRGCEPSERSLFILLLAVLIFSRWIAYPASIWDQDEANFALGVLRFDPLHNQPHAPFFPLWIVLGKAVKILLPGVSAQDCLRLVSVVASVWIFFPLTALWRRFLPPLEAMASSALYLFLPAPWLLSGRAYTEPTATAVFVSGVAFWVLPKPTRPELIAGGVFLSAAILVRPQWAPLAIPLGFWALWRCKSLTSRLSIVVPPLVACLATGAVMVNSAGGIRPLLDAVEQHRRYMAAAGTGFSWSYPEFSVFSAVGGTVPGAIWCLFAIAGGWALVARKENRELNRVFVGLVLLPHLLLLLFGENSTLVRYSLPVLALSCGLVFVGIQSLIRRPGWSVACAAVPIVLSWIVVIPALEQYRQISPVVAAMEYVEGGSPSGVVAWDRKLVSFVMLRHETGSLLRPGVWDYQVELGMFNRQFHRDQTAVFAGQEKEWVSEVESRMRFSCQNSLLCRIASPRFLEISVVDGCALVRPQNPSITRDQVRGGALIPPS